MDKEQEKDNLIVPIKQRMANIYGFTIVGENIIPPACEMPEYVQERIFYFSQFFEDGLTFFGGLVLILGHEEQHVKEQFESFTGETYPEPTEEFIKWRDEGSSIAEMEIAAHLIYPAPGIEEKRDAYLASLNRK